ncbi:MAG: hypothetical protein OXF26_01305 [Alphaproteobacteria bacterium]|nr:hypothetical protein [Alphaproteobacteria bacterium]
MAGLYAIPRGHEVFQMPTGLSRYHGVALAGDDQQTLKRDTPHDAAKKEPSREREDEQPDAADSQALVRRCDRQETIKLQAVSLAIGGSFEKRVV